MEPNQVPAAMVEAVARLLFNADRPNGTDWWAEPVTATIGWSGDRKLALVKAREVLAAALSVCEAREEWRHVWPSPDGLSEYDVLSSWFAAPVSAADGAVIEHRLTWVFTTPAEPVPDGETTLTPAEASLAALDRFEVVQYNGMVGWLCRPCAHLSFIARDADGDQKGLTLAEVADDALEHECQRTYGGSMTVTYPTEPVPDNGGETT